MKKLFTSQPMRGKTDKEILNEKAKAIEDGVEMPNFGELEIKDSKYFKRCSSFEIDEMIKSNKKILDDIAIPKTKWSGRIEFSDDESDVTKQFGKMWTCDIRTSHTTHPHILLHEELHARSISYFDKQTYFGFLNTEEVSVQFLTQEIRKKIKLKLLKEDMRQKTIH